MKVIVEKETNLSVVIFKDADTVTITDSNLAGNDSDGIEYIFNSLNSSNVNLIENATVPEGWSPNKYTLNGETWALNTDWVDPDEEVAPE